MCYNDLNVCVKCRINIVSSGDGWNDSVTAYGTICEKGDSLRLDYPIAGDECTLKVENKIVTQERRGSQYFYLTFTENETTKCIIGEGALSGSYDIYTHSIKILKGKGGCRITLIYNSGSDGETIRLTLTAAKLANGGEK